jgi:hypothetical protein
MSILGAALPCIRETSARAGELARRTSGSRERPTMNSDRLWTADETAEYLRVPKATLYQWHYLGVGPKPGKVGRHLRYDPDEVKRWFRQQQTAERS